MEGRRRGGFARNSSRTSGQRKSGTGASGSLPSKSIGATSSNPQVEEETGDDSPIAGTCAHMCPENERLQRERLGDLAVFERLHGNPSKTCPDLAVKKFCRTISTKEIRPSDVRPLRTLEDTLSHLLRLLDSSDHPFETVHDFIFDRTRSIRQDLSMQNITNGRAVAILEKVVEFHVISLNKLPRCGKGADLSSARHLNMEQLGKSMSTLYSLYDKNRRSHLCHQKESEFRSLHVLLHLDDNAQPLGEQISLWFRRVPCSVLYTKEMAFARSALRFFRLGYYKQFLTKVASEASHLQYCVLEPYIYQARVSCLSCINSAGYKLHPYSISYLAELLMMKEADLEELCRSCGLAMTADEAGNKTLQAKQSSFAFPKGGLQEHMFSELEQFITGREQLKLASQV